MWIKCVCEEVCVQVLHDCKNDWMNDLWKVWIYVCLSY